MMNTIGRRMGQALHAGPERWMQSPSRAAQHNYSKQPEPEPRSRLSHLYEVLRTSFGRGKHPSEQDIRSLCQAIEDIPLSDLGINPTIAQNMTYSNLPQIRELRTRATKAAAVSGAPASAAPTLAGFANNVTYFHIHEDANMTIGIFQLDEGARIPLHNHPGMTVFSRLLYGTLHVRSYDWADDHNSSSSSSSSGQAAPMLDCGDDSSSTSSDASMTMAHPHSSPPPPATHGANEGGSEPSDGGATPLRAARLVADQVISAPAPISVLFPQSGGNIHAFTAISPCAILDVLTPPYAPNQGRDCTYYLEVLPEDLLQPAADGHPLLIPSDRVAAYAAQQQASQPQAPSDEALARLNSCLVAPAAAGGAAGGGVALAGAVVQLQEMDGQPDWLDIKRGVYKGQQMLPDQQRRRSSSDAA